MKNKNLLSTISTLSITTVTGIIVLPSWAFLTPIFAVIAGLGLLVFYLGPDKTTELLKVWAESWGRDRKDCGCP
jgi:hypothetical protein